MVKHKLHVEVPILFNDNNNFAAFLLRGFCLCQPVNYLLIFRKNTISVMTRLSIFVKLFCVFTEKTKTRPQACAGQPLLRPCCQPSGYTLCIWQTEVLPQTMLPTMWLYSVQKQKRTTFTPTMWPITCLYSVYRIRRKRTSSAQTLLPTSWPNSVHFQKKDNLCSGHVAKVVAYIMCIFNRKMTFA
jgi:hypothetical protein